MPLPKVIYSLLALSGLGVTAITAASFLPAGPPANGGATDSSAYAAADISRLVRGQASGRTGRLLLDHHCLQSDASSEDLREAARSRLSNSDILTGAIVCGFDDEHDVAADADQDQPDYAVEPLRDRHYGLNLIERPAAAVQDEGRWLKHILNPGETLGTAWGHWGLPLQTLYQLLADAENAAILNRVHPGQEAAALLDEDGALRQLRLWRDREAGTEWVRDAETGEYTRQEIGNLREITHRAVTGEVRGDVAASAAVVEALSAAEAATLGGVLDRYLPSPDGTRNGDRYTLLIEHETFAGDDTPYNVRLLAFSYSGATLSVSAARHTDGRFYTPDGHDLLPPFDRQPFVGEYRVTSGYNKGRRHPVTGRVAPHRGTDFSMPVGTPIVAPANGTVVEVDSHPLAGKFVVIEHSQGYSTRYLHLKQALVQMGQSVQRGEQIALSGNSGLTTSPHLHYELHVDGRAVDAMRADLPRSEPLVGEDLAEFQRIAQPLLAELRDQDAARQIALSPSGERGR
jgi:murein DD-endopeptidase